MRSSAFNCGVWKYCSNSLRSASSWTTVTLAGIWKTPPPQSSPNDVLVNDQKLAGTLIESETVRGTTWFLIGIGINVVVAGIIRSNAPQDNNVAYVHLPFLQQASRVGLGVVTQFNVKVDSAGQLDSVASTMDETFRADQQPTQTRPEKAFFAETAKQMIEAAGGTAEEIS